MVKPDLPVFVSLPSLSNFSLDEQMFYNGVGQEAYDYFRSSLEQIASGEISSRNVNAYFGIALSVKESSRNIRKVSPNLREYLHCLQDSCASAVSQYMAVVQFN